MGRGYGAEEGWGICLSLFWLLQLNPPALRDIQHGGLRNPWLQRALGTQAVVRQVGEGLDPATTVLTLGWRGHRTSSLPPCFYCCLPTVLFGEAWVCRQISFIVRMALTVA